MAEVFWISFHIAESGNSERRYQALISEIRALTSDKWWTESVNFLLFDSDHAIDDIAANVWAAFDPGIDLALLARTGAQEARAIGAVEDGLLYELMPYARRFQAHPPSSPQVPLFM